MYLGADFSEFVPEPGARCDICRLHCHGFFYPFFFFAIFADSIATVSPPPFFFAIFADSIDTVFFPVLFFCVCLHTTLPLGGFLESPLLVT